MNRQQRDAWGLGVARAVGDGADCRRRLVGAVILDTDHRIAGAGYNGAPPGEDGCLSGACPRGRLTYDEVTAFSDYNSGPGFCLSTHAEVNAIMDSERLRRKGGTMYITDEPCAGCRKVLANSGLHRVVWPDGSSLAREILDDLLRAASAATV